MVSKKTCIQPSKFSIYYTKWKGNQFQEIRLRKTLPDDVKQKIYDMWIENSINSTDGRNGRNFINISKKKYLQIYGSIDNCKVVVEENANKRGRLNYSVTEWLSRL